MNIEDIKATALDAAQEIAGVYQAAGRDGGVHLKPVLQEIIVDAIKKAVKEESARCAAIMVQKLRHSPPALTVWEGAMPESNGKSNFTAILRRKDAVPFETNEHCIAISEYPGRVKYEADCVRYLIGELAERPDILAYDSDTHSDYVPRDHERFISFYDLRKLMEGTSIIGLAAALEEKMKDKS